MLCFQLLACSGPVKKGTLRDIDIASEKQTQGAVYIKAKSDDEIRKAYEAYLKHATDDTSLRQSAINRLAELEFELGNKIQKENENLKEGGDEAKDEELYNQRLNKTIELLSTSIRDFPNSKGNDKTLYQLAKAYDLQGQQQNTRRTLERLVHKHKKSPHYVESQFRLAEIYFSERNFKKAEDAYNEVVSSKKNEVFYEKAIFKRGWTRFKLEFYEEAIDDFLVSVTYHGFPDYEDLNPQELQQFNEYFRAIGLCFSYLGGAEPINEFFKNNSDFKYLYYTYAYLADIYLKQLRYTEAADTLDYFITHYPKSENIPESHIKMLDIWKESGFQNQLFKAVEVFYSKYNPSSQYWVKTNPNRKIYKKIFTSLEKYLLIMAAHHHNKYQKKHKKADYVKAKQWYERYLKHYNSYARKNNIHFLFAELLAERKSHNKALFYYELAAYDGEIILNKDAAYATITTTNMLLNKKADPQDKEEWLNKHIKYSTIYTRLYPADKRSVKIISNAAAMAFKAKQYSRAIEISELIPSTSVVSKSTLNAQIVKAHAYFELKQYANAEAAYQTVLDQERLGKKTKAKMEDKLALSIYKQAAVENEQKNIEQATRNYLRISDAAPRSSIAATGMYDAIALFMQHEKWNEAIYNIKRFKSLYPRHKLNAEASKKLSVAYLKSGQGIKAAQEFEKMSSFGGDTKTKIAALWKAAELYESKNDTKAAIRTYKDLVKNYRRPYPQYLEAMLKITTLYGAAGNTKQVTSWRKKIISADKRVSKKHKNDRTKFIASTASLSLAKDVHINFDKIKLTLPLKKSLQKKKRAMQSAVEYYGKASTYGIAETTTEATFAIAQIYKNFSTALLESERPRNLKGDDLEQYQILLEDRAFPFEEKAIEFFETNLTRVNQGVYNEWIKKSYAELEKLFPARYKREARLDDYISVLH